MMIFLIEIDQLRNTILSKFDGNSWSMRLSFHSRLEKIAKLFFSSRK